MKGQDKTKEELIKELEKIKQEYNLFKASIVNDNSERRQSKEALRESAEKLDLQIDLFPQMIYEFDLNGNLTYLNKQGLDIFGYSQKEIEEGLNILTGFIPEEWDRMKEMTKRLLEGEKLASIEYIALRKDGSTFPFLTNSNIIFKDNKAVGVRGMAIDITERKQAEEILKNQESRIQSIFRSAPVGIGVVSNRILMEVNYRMYEITGYPADELIGQSSRILYPNDAEFERVGRYKYEEIEKHGTGSIETHFLRKDGKLIDVILNSTPIDQDDLSKGVAFTVLDITERIQAAKALQDSEEKFRRLFEEHSAIKLLINPVSGAIIDANNAAAAYYGWSCEELKRMRIDEINTLTPEEVKKKMDKVLSGDRIQFEFRHRRKDGSVRDVEVYSSKLVIGNRDLLHSIIHDITERKQAENALIVSESNLNTLVNNRNESIWSIDNDYKIIVCNDYFRDAYFAAYQVELKVGLSLINILSPELKAFWKPKYDTVFSGEKISFEFNETIQGSIFYFEVFLNPILVKEKVTGVSALRKCQ
ncbi:MAG: PAS domain S-box protein [Mariniphaga sp.]|nr:PAS domain S-box protein [Mariniphaga sp.]